MMVCTIDTFINSICADSMTPLKSVRSLSERRKSRAIRLAAEPHSGIRKSIASSPGTEPQTLPNDESVEKERSSSATLPGPFGTASLKSASCSR